MFSNYFNLLLRLNSSTQFKTLIFTLPDLIKIRSVFLLGGSL